MHIVGILLWNAPDHECDGLRRLLKELINNAAGEANGNILQVQ